MRTYNGYELPRVLTRDAARRLGITESRIRTEVRRGSWRPLARGIVLSRPEEPGRGDWVAAGIALGGPSAALSGWDAARCHGLGSSRPPTETVLVLSRHSANRVVGGVRIRETHRAYDATLTPAEAVPYELTPVVPAARAVCDAALQYRALTPVRGLVTSAVQKRRCTVEQLLEEWADVPRRDSRFLRLALADVAAGARSAAEAVCAERLRSRALPPFELNVPVRDQTGEMVMDVYWRQLRAALEVDSREFHFSEDQWKATMQRHNRLSAMGISVVHYPPSVVMGHDRSWLVSVETWLRARARELGLPYP